MNQIISNPNRPTISGLKRGNALRVYHHYPIKQKFFNCIVTSKPIWNHVDETFIIGIKFANGNKQTAILNEDGKWGVDV